MLYVFLQYHFPILNNYIIWVNDISTPKKYFHTLKSFLMTFCMALLIFFCH